MKESGKLALVALCVATLAPRAQALPVISELLYDGAVSDAAEAFTEIYGTAGFDLSGWKLVGINGADGGAYRTVDLTGAIIPSDGILVVATSSATGDVLAARDFVGSVDWQNGPDAVRLIDADGNIIDALQYGDAGIYNAGEGFAAPDVMAGQSLARDWAALDTGDNFADFAIMDVPTPGSMPAAPEQVPEPATAFLVGLGLVGAGGIHRRKRAAKDDRP